MISTLLFALALSAQSQPLKPVAPLGIEARTIVLCARTDKQGKVVDTRLMQSSGSEDLDKSARTTLMGSTIMDEAVAAQTAGVWLPVAIATNGAAGPDAMPSCAMASLSH